MVSFPPNFIPTAILAVILAFLLRLGERAIAYWFRHTIQERRAKRQWYQELVELLKEIKFSASSKRGALDYWKSKSPSAAENFDQAQLEGLRRYLKQQGIDDPDEFIKMYAEQLLQENQETVKEGLEVDMKYYEASLLHHLAKYPDDIDEAILKECGDLLQKLHAMGITGQITSEVEDNVGDTADTVIVRCNREIADLQAWWWL